MVQSRLQMLTAYKQSKQVGFTLLELMVSIVLGLLILAATVQVLVTSKTSVTVQQASSEIQSDVIFGLSSLKKSIRAVNFDAFKGKNGNEYIMNDETPGGGVALTVTTDDANGNTVLGNILPKIASTNLVSLSGTKESNLESTSGTLKSDELVLQHKMAVDGFDCEGNAVQAGYYVVERYYLVEDTETKRDGEPTPLALACNAVHYGVQRNVANNTSITPVQSMRSELNREFKFVSTAADIADKGTILMNRVDHFHFLLGVEEGVDVYLTPSASRIRYLTVSNYNSITTNPKPKIVSVRFGMVVRSANPSSAAIENSAQIFNVLEQRGLKLKSTVADKSKYQREVFESTITIRNGRG